MDLDDFFSSKKAKFEEGCHKISKLKSVEIKGISGIFSNNCHEFSDFINESDVIHAQKVFRHKNINWKNIVNHSGFNKKCI
jgi:hypothetical protein